MAMSEMDYMSGGGKSWIKMQCTPSSLTEYDSTTHLINIGFKPKKIIMFDPKYNNAAELFCLYDEDYNPNVYYQVYNQGTSTNISIDRAVEDTHQFEAITDNGFKIGFASNMSSVTTLIAIG